MTVPALLILGTDAVLAATPATPVQLAHACLAAGYQAVIPASWGDELVAARALDRLNETDTPIVQCSCPHVARRLSTHGGTLGSAVFTCAPPPIATAKYLRALYAPVRPNITFAGACPSAQHETIDVWLKPEDLARALSDRGISLRTQPTEFDAVLSPDRRRFFSEPGGVPSRIAMRELKQPVELHELTGGDVIAETAQRLLAGERSLIDMAPALGCTCAGALPGRAAGTARALVRTYEPPRALGPVVDNSVSLVLDVALPTLELPATPVVPVAIPAGLDVGALKPAQLEDAAHRPPAVETSQPAAEVAASSSPVAIESARPSPATPLRAVLGGMPQAIGDAGRPLPRAYVARRRSTPKNVARATGGARKSGAQQSRTIPWLVVAAILAGAGALAAYLLQR